MKEAAEKTGRDVGSYVLFMVIADETDEAARAKREHYKAGADDEADHPDTGNGAGTQCHGHSQSHQAQAVGRQAQAAGRCIVEAQQLQRTGQQRGEQCGHAKARRQVIHVLPAVLVQRTRLPDEQIAQDLVVGQHQQGAQGPAIQVDDQPRENQRHRRQAPAPGQAQHREHAQGGPGQGHAFLAAIEQARGIDRAGGQGQVGT